MKVIKRDLDKKVRFEDAVGWVKDPSGDVTKDDLIFSEQSVWEILNAYLMVKFKYTYGMYFKDNIVLCSETLVSDLIKRDIDRNNIDKHLAVKIIDYLQDKFTLEKADYCKYIYDSCDELSGMKYYMPSCYKELGTKYDNGNYSQNTAIQPHTLSHCSLCKRKIKLIETEK